jgi:hypothetical protein
MNGRDAFFGFNPRAARLGLALGAVACAILAAWALANARAGTERFGVARGGVAAGLMFAFGYAWVRLRPRAGWGITLTPTVLVVARPFSEEPLRLAWGQISVVHPAGPGGRAILVVTQAGDRILIPRHLFATLSDFEAMTRAIQSRLEPVRLDA